MSSSTARSPPLPGAVTGAEDEEEEAALSISDRRTLYLVNIFIGTTARFLNSFSAVCEEKLADVHRRILHLDATLRLLESRLSSTGWAAKETEGFSGAEAAGPSHSYRSTAESGEPSSGFAVDIQQKLTIFSEQPENQSVNLQQT